jgi:hypothetical protein
MRFPPAPLALPRGRRHIMAVSGPALALTFLLVLWAFPVVGRAATPAIDLATADNFAVLAGSGITNTGPTTIDGDIGTFPTQTQSGLGSVTLTGTNQAGNAVTQQAKVDLDTAYGVAAGRGPATEIATDLAGQSLVPGVYDSADGTFGNTGVLTLDGQDQTDPVFVLQASSSLITGSGSSVVLINGADACNVYWQVGSSVTLGTASGLSGTIMALTSISLTTGATLEGRALARNGAVTMDTNTITRAACTEPVGTSTTVASSDTTSATGEPVTLTATVSTDDSSTPTGTVEFFDGDTSLGTAPLREDGTAELITTDLDEGTHAITVVYLGAPGYGPSISTDLTQTIQSPGVPGAPDAPSSPATPAGPTTPSSPTAPPATGTPGVPKFTG